VAASQQERSLLLIAAAFAAAGALSLWLQTGSWLAPSAGTAAALLGLSLHVWLNRFCPKRDPLILPLALLLSIWGLLIVTRVAPNFALRQVSSLAVACGAFALITASRDYLRWLKRFKYTWLFIAFVLLAATLLLGVNPAGTGARLWLRIGGFFLQPSELLRLLMIAFWAAFLAERAAVTPTPEGALMHTLRSFTPAIAMWLIAVGLLASQQDLGAASLLLLTFAFMLYLATGRRRVPLTLVLAFAGAGVAGYFLSARVATRITIWLNPDVDPQGASFQVIQSLIAIASGGFFGQGLNQGLPDYVPAVHTDFPFVVVAEEFGLLGALAMIAMLAILCFRAWRIALRSRSLYVRLLTGGIAASLAVQVLVILGGNLALAPLTGVTVPFVSFGGSSLLVWFVSAGLIVRLSDASVVHSTIDPRDAAVDLGTQRRAAFVTAGFFALLGIASTVIMLPRAASLYARVDNPRRVDDERAIARGAILARDGQPLALAAPAAQINGRPVFSRTYLAPWAVSAVGYYSERYGVGGIEAFADGTLRGERSLGDALLHRAQYGRSITTTIDPLLQRYLAEALGDRPGAAVVLDWRSGEVLALVSSPKFDPNHLDRDWEALIADARAPLVNRATQGLYQPGALLPWLYGVEPLRFEWDRSDRYALGQPVPFELKNEAAPYPVTATISETLGQGSLRLTPLRVAVATAQRMRGGAALQPSLILSSTNTARTNAPGAPAYSGEYLGIALGSANSYVSWRVRAEQERVVVIVLEQTGDSLAPQQQIIVP
jgi:cell division protein FtsW (lipid II flippase)